MLLQQKTTEGSEATYRRPHTERLSLRLSSWLSRDNKTGGTQLCVLCETSAVTFTWFFFSYINVILNHWAEWPTCGSGSQHASVVDAHRAVRAANGQVVRHQRRDGDGRGRPSTVYQYVLKKKKITRTVRWEKVRRCPLLQQKWLKMDWGLTNSPTR